MEYDGIIPPFLIRFKNKPPEREPPSLRFPVSSREAYIEQTEFICVRSGPIRYRDCYSEQLDCCCDGHRACWRYSCSYSSRSSHYRDCSCRSLASWMRSGWLASYCFHPYSSYTPSDVPCRSGSCCCSGCRH